MSETHTLHGRTLGFTLIELSIVLVIIGLIAGGVVAGKELIHQAQLRKTIKQVEQFDTAINTFRGKYNCLPGDCHNPGMFGFTGADLNPGTHPNMAENLAIAGNGDGKISYFSDGSLLHFEYFQAFWWLHEAGLINVSGLTWSASGNSYVDYTSIPIAIGGGRAAGDASSSVSWNILYIDASKGQLYWSTNEYLQQPGHYYWLSPQVIALGLAEAIPPGDAYAIDVKMDDGAPRSGRVACYEKSDPSVMKVFSPFGKETIDEYEEAEATQSGADRGEAA